MLGREKLTAYDCNEGSYDSMGFPWEYKEMVYNKDKADKVMDAMERRIARLFNLVAGYQRNSIGLSAMYNRRLDSELERIQELEAKNNNDYINYQRKTQEQAKRIAELEHQVLTDCTCDSSKSATLRMDLNKAQEHIRELEAKLYGSKGETNSLLNRINNFFTEDAKARNIIEDCYKCIHQQMATISKMEMSLPTPPKKTEDK